EQHDKHSNGGDVSHEGLPGKIRSRVLDIEFGFREFDFHEPPGKDSNEYASQREHNVGGDKIEELKEI
ncbi:MAG: hypothetical protein ACPGTP_08025, partial [Bacteroidia bacterium]